jgi:formate dehydrogenase assembly factor FdhD
MARNLLLCQAISPRIVDVASEAFDVCCWAARSSGSFELAQKAAVLAGCPLLVTVGTPSTFDVELPLDRGITLCGFVRHGNINVYSEPWRIQA